MMDRRWYKIWSSGKWKKNFQLHTLYM